MRSASEPGHAVQHRRGQQHPTSPSRRALPRAADAGAHPEADAQRQRAGRRGQRVGGHQLLGAHHVRQRRRTARRAGTGSPTGRPGPAPNSTGPRRSAGTATASTATSPTRTKFDQASTWRRDHRSSSTPTNGPSTLNGSSTTASAAAIATGDGCSLGREDDVRRQRHLEHAVGQLAGDPDREEPAEPGRAAGARGGGARSWADPPRPAACSPGACGNRHTPGTTARGVTVTGTPGKQPGSAGAAVSARRRRG